MYRETSIKRSIQRFEQALKQQELGEWISFTTEVTEIDPLAWIEYHNEESYLYYWDKPDSGFSLAACGVACSLKATGEDRFQEISRQSRSLKKQHLALTDSSHSMAEPFLAGGYSFYDHNIEKSWSRFGAAHFFLPSTALLKSGRQTLLTLTLRAKGKTRQEILDEIEERLEKYHRTRKRIRKSTLSTTGETSDHSDRPPFELQHREDERNRWGHKVEKCRNLIGNNVFDKIVIARAVELHASQSVNTPCVMYHLRQTFPECYNFLIRLDSSPDFIGATPERLIALKKNRMNTEGLAGSISRGKSAVEDVALGNKLITNRKNRGEHQIVVKEICHKLRPYSERIEHPKKPVLKRLHNVQHLFTPISAVLQDGVTIHELAGALHPTPAVGGYPRNSSVPWIRTIEKLDRGWYAGPIGWFNPSGNGEFSVAIRSAHIDGYKARLYAGCGIVEDSEAETEWKESELKFRPILEALQKSVKERPSALHE